MSDQSKSVLSQIIIFVILVSFCGFFLYKWLDLRSEVIDRRNQILSNKVDSLGIYRDSLGQSRKEYDIKFDSLQKIIELDNTKLIQLDIQLNKSNIELMNAKTDLENEKHKLDEINKKIRDLKQNPIRRGNDELINSLRKKLN